MLSFSADSARRPRRRWLARLVLAGCSLAVMLLGAEFVLRAVDGYRLFAARLQFASPRCDSAIDLPPGDRLLETFLQQPALARSDLDRAWFPTSPPPVPTRPLPAAMAERFAAGYHPMFLYQWNEVLVRSTWQKGIGSTLGHGIRKPDSFFVFTPADGTPVPRYRFPTGVTLPTGATINSLGFRGRELSVAKPPRVVRIACVGASTTVDDHILPHSYPEMLEHYLGLWGRARGLDVTFEVVNAACEGYFSWETVANVRHYVLPLAVDYVVYYEGANQLQLPQIRKHLQVAEPVPPAPSLGGLFEPAAVAIGSREWLYEHCAIARRLHTVMARGGPLAEPAKPEQTLSLPAGLEEQQPDLARAGELLDLGRVLADLDTIEADVEAAGARLVLCSFAWFVHDGLLLDPMRSEHVFRHLNEAYWPVRYSVLRRLADLQNRWFAAWAAAHAVDWIDVAAVMPADPRLFLDAIHKNGLGVRCHAWAALAGLLPRIERDLASGRIPVADRKAYATHPNVGPMRVLTRAELDAGN